MRISRTYSVVTPESAEEGDFAETGYVYQSRDLTFRELIRELSEFQGLSCYPASESYVRNQANVWATQSDGDTDYRTGANTSESLHCDDDRDPRVRRWWALALRVAGLTQEGAK